MGQEPSGPASANCQRSGWFDSLRNEPKTFVPQGSLKGILILKLVTEFLMEKKDLLGGNKYKLDQLQQDVSV